MIRANKSRLFHSMFSLYHQRLLRRSFDQIYFYSKGTLPTTPVIYVANHSSWWDGLIFFHLSRTVLPQDLYIMMHESGLKQYPYFKRLGAFSINRNNPKDILHSLQYAQQLVEDGKSVWMFPQGDEFHLETRPLGFQSGITYVLEHCPHTPVVPMSFYYSFGQKKRPEVYIEAGSPLYHHDLPGQSRVEKTTALEQVCTEQLDELKQLVVTKQRNKFSNLL